jgi:hypothetical protein
MNISLRELSIYLVNLWDTKSGFLQTDLWQRARIQLRKQANSIRVINPTNLVLDYTSCCTMLQ